MEPVQLQFHQNKMSANKKASIEFAWIFSLIVGALVLFLAFYFIGTSMLSKTYEEATIEAQSLDIILNSFSYFGELKAKTSTIIEPPKDSVINVSCKIPNAEILGSNTITITKKNQEGIPRTVYNKYIFSDSALEYKKLQLLSIPVELPWRVADIVILWDYEKKYCFVRAPQFIKDTLGNEAPESLNISSIYFENAQAYCPENSIKVCFYADSNCKIEVNINEGRTTKQAKNYYFIDKSLMYASIFSDGEIYDCNIKRLASRLSYQISIYKEKATALNGRECSADFDLNSLKQNAEELKTNINQNTINSLKQSSESVAHQNNIADCKLF